MLSRSRYAGDAALVLTTLIWGSTFILAKDILSEWTPLAYITVRFGIAAVALALMFRKELAAATRSDWLAGFVLGMLVGCGFVVQAMGQVYTSAAKSAFITGLTTPLVPLCAYLLLRARPTFGNMLGIVCATLGGFILLAPPSSNQSEGMLSAVNIGDLLTLSCTILFATHIVLLGVYTKRTNVKRLTVLQITTATILFVIVWTTIKVCALFGADAWMPDALAREAAPLVWSVGALWRVLYLGLVGTLAAFLLWTWGQARVEAVRAAIIFNLEPVFATLFAVALRGRDEWLGGWASFGAALILLGVLISEVRRK
ncbi:MAG: EamA family transporter [Pyrinomonadaceae bacterium MAG19_C2-C3]|nr:EamA family transporter [Pyrinomonadaceae bacterium MAG19_C2-C3]